MAEARPSSRLSFVDLARGLAVLLMLQTHVYDAWLRPELRGTWFFQQSQFLGGLPGADFLFLLGVGSSLANETSRGRGGSTKQVVATGMRRGAWLLSVAFLFRIIMYLASDRPEIEAIFKVDILNCLGVSLALMTCVEIAGSRTLRIMAALAGGAFFAIGASFVWDGDLVTGLPNRIAGYFSGRVFNSSFPVFPWTAFAFAGHGVGTLIAAARGPRLNLRIIQLTLGALAAIPLALALDRAATLGPHYDFWWTSPNFIAIKTSVLLLILCACFAVEKVLASASRATRALAGPVTGALIQMGRTSLLIYCVHIDLVYGSRAFPSLWKSCEITEASRYLVALTLSMLTLSYVWSYLRSKVARV